MFIKITAFFLIFHLVRAQDVENCCNATNTQISTNFLNETLIKLNEMQAENENLQKKLNQLNTSIQLQLVTQQNEFKKNLSDFLASINTTSRAQMLTTLAKNENFENDAQSPNLNTLPSNCAEALQKSGRKNGVHKIKIPDSDIKPFYVYCTITNSDDKDEIYANITSPWMIIQRRMDGSIDFNRNWIEYQQGFGNLEGEFFIGLDKLNALTQSGLHELWVQLEDFEGEKRYAKYSSFAIDGANEGYPISILGVYSGNAGDSLIGHIAQKFSTKDVDNDTHKDKNCAQSFVGAWWHIDCFYSHLNGKYYKSTRNDVSNGVIWEAFRGNTYSLKYVHMAIRPKQ